MAENTRVRVLFVDDEESVLRAIDRQLGEIYDLTLAVGAYAAIEQLQSAPPFAVIVADMRMPGMDGVTFLAQARRMNPDAVRMMLTGNAEQQTAVQAVNEGRVFRFINKPVDTDTLRAFIEESVEQHRLITAEKVLLEKTLNASVRVLVEILSMADPASFGRSQQLKKRAEGIAAALDLEERWKLELACMLAPLGNVAVPPALLLRGQSSKRLPAFEAGVLARLPAIGASLIAKIPRLEDVAAIVLYQEKHFDGSGVPDDGVAGESIPIASRILKILKDLADFEEQGVTTEHAFMRLRARQGWYDRHLLGVAEASLAGPLIPPAASAIRAQEVAAGDLIVADLHATDGTLLMRAGHVASELEIARLRGYLELGLVTEPVFVCVSSECNKVA